MMTETDPKSWPAANQIYEMLTDAIIKDVEEEKLSEEEKAKYFKENLLSVLGHASGESAQA
jgi:hypothetical protein